MSEEYLWDKSGEPDPEIQELEQILGTLRYQPKPLELPDEIKPVRRKHNLALLAIAATLVMALLAGALWLMVRTESKPQEHNATGGPTPAPSIVSPQPAPRNREQETVDQNPKQSQPQRDVVANNNNRRRSRAGVALNSKERKEALEAKEQLMVAMRLASEKLNIVQRKTHGPATPGQIRNQHKIG